MAYRFHPTRLYLSRKWLLYAGAGVFAALCFVLASYPWWAGGLAKARLADRLERRLGQPVTIDDVDVGYHRIEVTGLAVQSFVGLDQIVVELSGGPFWPLLGPNVQAVRVEGGHIHGRRSDLESMFSGGGKPSKTPGEESSKRRWPKVSVQDIRVKVIQPSPGVERLETLLEVSSDGKTLELVLRDVEVEVAGKVARAERMTSTIEGVESTRPSDLFPVEIRVENGGASLTDAIALARVSGSITVEDLRASEVSVDLAGTFSDQVEDGKEATTNDKLWSIVGKVRRDRTAGDLRLEMKSFELGRVPQVLAKLPLVDSEGATIEGSLRVVFADGQARLEGDLGIEGLHVSHPVLASDVVRDIGFSMQFAGSVDPDRYRAEIESVRLKREDLAVEVSGTVVHPPTREQRKYDLELRVPPVPCQALLDAMPQELIPSLVGFRLRGNFDMDVGADIDFSDLEKLDLHGHVGIWNCSVSQVPPRVSAVRLAGPFVHRIAMKDGSERVVRLFLGSGTFTPLPAISPFMVGAVLTTEDGGFYSHRGFLPSQFEVALARNLRAGKVRIGASTITMQMVKNVLLSHERTVSRKLQEMFLTWYVERSLTKDRIMEIYLNIVELGPGIYGITRGSQHYFGKHPLELNPVEATYLALMLPDPVRRHAHYCRGALSKAMEVKLRRILDISHARKRLSDEDYEMWKDWPVTFDLTDRASEKECLAEIERLLRAEQGQQALSGLLTGQDVESLHETQLIDPFADFDPSEADATGRPAMEIDAGAQEQDVRD